MSNSENNEMRALKKDKWIRLWRIAKRTFLTAFILIMLGIGCALGYALSVIKTVPPLDPKQLSTLTATSFIYDRNQKILGQSQTDGNRQLINSLSEVSPFIVNAFVSGEDKTFYSNIGVDPAAILRSAAVDILKGEKVTGASTITQQTIKNVYFPDFYKEQRGLRVKIQEAFMAFQLQRLLSKDEIMMAYLNWIYFGKSKSGINLYGIESASEAIFGIPAKSVNIAQAAVLASLPNSPGNLNPFTNMPGLKERQGYILDQMKQNGYIDDNQYEEAVKFDIQGSLVKADPIKTGINAHPYLISEVEQKTEEALLTTDRYRSLKPAEAHDQVQQALDSGGYKIYTTVDTSMQDAVEGVLEDDGNFPANAKVTVKDPGTGKDIQQFLEAGASLIDNKTGGILAVGGGRSFQKDANNHTLLPRQPGSTMKPLAVYGPAVEKKMIFPGTGIDDVPFAYPGTSQYPQNWDGQYRGWVSARVALMESYDVPAIKLFQKLTPEVGLSYVKKMGITTLTNNDNYLPAAIGGLYHGLTLEENTSAYTTFANQGVHKDSYLIDRIVDRQGRLVYKHQPKQTQVFTTQTAFMMTDMLQDVVRSSHGTAYRIGTHFQDKAIAGKTGTTNDGKDIWFVGYTPDVTLGVWEGYNLPYPIEDQHHHLAVWNKLMDRIYPLIQKPTGAFAPPPEGVAKAKVFMPSGKMPSDLDVQFDQLNQRYAEMFGSLIVDDWMTTDAIPTETDDTVVKEKYAQINNQTYWLADPGTPVGGRIQEGFLIKTDPYTPPQNASNYSPPWDVQWEMQTESPVGANGNSPAVGSPQDVRVASAAGQNAINLTWSAVNGADGYVVWRSENSGPFQLIGDNVLAQAGYVDNNVTGTSSYSYRISAVVGRTIEVPGNTTTLTGVVTGLPNTVTPNPVDGLVGPADSLPERGNGNKKPRHGKR